MSLLKLGKYQEAYASINQLNQMEWASKSYKQEQSKFMEAVCARLLGSEYEAHAKEIY